MDRFVFRQRDPRFPGKTLQEAVAAALEQSSCRMVSRNRGSGTRVLIDLFLRAGGENCQPSG